MEWLHLVLAGAGGGGHRWDETFYILTIAVGVLIVILELRSSLLVDFMFVNANMEKTPKSILVALSGSFPDMHKTTQNLSCRTHTFPAEVEQGNALPSPRSSHTVNNCPFHGLLNATFFTFLGFLFVILPFKIALRWSTASGRVLAQ